MRRATRLLLMLQLTCGACTRDGVTTLSQLRPAVALPGNVAIDPRIAARVDLPLGSPSDGRVTVRITVTNSSVQRFAGGVCAERVDARQVGLETWYDVTAPDKGCPDIALVLAPEASGTVTATAELAKLRAVAGGAGGTVFLRVRHVMYGETAPVGVQSAAAPAAVP